MRDVPAEIIPGACGKSVEPSTLHPSTGHTGPHTCYRVGLHVMHRCGGCDHSWPTR